jgi:anti-anti-sigma factor
MEINVVKNGLVEIAEISGRVDATNSAELEAKLSAILASGSNRILVDLNGLSYISSSGLRVFLLMAKKLEKAGKICLCHLQPQVEQIFTISGFNTIFPIFATRDEGVAHLNKISE